MLILTKILIAKFAYKDIKNRSIGYILFELNCNYYLQILYKKDIDSCFKFKSANKLSAKLK